MSTLANYGLPPGSHETEITDADVVKINASWNSRYDLPAGRILSSPGAICQRLSITPGQLSALLEGFEPNFIIDGMPRFGDDVVRAVEESRNEHYRRGTGLPTHKALERLSRDGFQQEQQGLPTDLQQRQSQRAYEAANPGAQRL